MKHASPTWITRITARGRGAIGTLHLAGPAAVEVTAAYFQPANGRPFGAQPRGKVAYGKWQVGGDEYEELVVVRTAQDEVELHCHGGDAVVQLLEATLAQCGCRIRDWQAWVQERADDLIQAEAWSALAQATTDRSASILMDQFRGALSGFVRHLRDALQRGDLETASLELSDVLSRWNLGSHLIQPWRVAIVGPPNVGKSSLLNRILGYTRAIVFDQPGTTRDLLFARTALDGWPVDFFDTAGIREASNEIEEMGVRSARECSESADLVLLVSDRSRGWTDAEESLRTALKDALTVHNKGDLGPAEGARPEGYVVSAMTGSGVQQLLDEVLRRLVGQVPPPAAPVPFTTRQQHALNEVRLALESQDRQSALDALDRMDRTAEGC